MSPATTDTNCCRGNTECIFGLLSKVQRKNNAFEKEFEKVRIIFGKRKSFIYTSVNIQIRTSSHTLKTWKYYLQTISILSLVLCVFPEGVYLESENQPRLFFQTFDHFRNIYNQSPAMSKYDSYTTSSLTRHRNY